MSSNLWIARSLFVLLIHFRINEINTYECGTTEFIDPKIVRGSATVRGAWPFLAALFHVEEVEFFCGSTLISAKHVLTAAHCVQQKNSLKKLAPEGVTVLLGAYNLDVKTESGVLQRDVHEIFPHPDWNAFSEKYDADLAILVLSQIVEFTKYIRPICMPEDDPPANMFGSIVGWGLSERTTGATHEPIPLLTYTKVLNDSYCYTTQQFLSLFSSTRFFCGGEGGSPNKGDSGGAKITFFYITDRGCRSILSPTGGFFVLSGKSWVQYGIISASLSDARGNVLPNSFSLYTNLRAFRSWIDGTVEAGGGNVLTLREKEKIKIDFWCNYEIIETLYKCSVWSSNVTDDNFEVDSFTGTHLNGLDARDVTVIWFWTGKLRYIPDGIGKKFKFLERFSVGYSDRNMGLRRLARSNFKDMERLWYLDVHYNNLETVDEDTLKDLPNLKHIAINNNKLKMLQKYTFEKNLQLKHVNVNSNQLEILHADLFKNNALLEEALFKDNKLKIISIDFTRLRSIKSLDFHGNGCIDKSLDDGNSLTEFQNVINYQCNGIQK